MNRTEIVQRMIDATNGQAYLEIGVFKGENFLPIRCRRKVAVDPAFQIPRWKRSPLRNLFRGSSCQYYEVPSDTYFQKHWKPGEKFDVAFIDGLHTFEQSLADLRNCLSALATGGCVVLHDCSPPHAAAEFPAPSLDAAFAANPPGWTGEWCGDVWKTIWQTKHKGQGLDTFVLDCDYGVGVVVKTAEDWSIEEDTTTVDSLTFEDLDRDRQAMINLKPPAFVDEFLKQWKRPS